MNLPPANVALYGGSFDPVHRGHLAVARAAAGKFSLSRVIFVPAGVQPLKSALPVTPYEERFAMLQLALAAEEQFTASRLESPEAMAAAGTTLSYTIDTVRRLRAQLHHATRLYLLLGMDAFQQIAKWRAAVELLRSVEFIVAHRPGFPLTQVPLALPVELRPDDAAVALMRQTGVLESGGVRLHLLPDVSEDISATAIRQAVRSGRNLEELVPWAVSEYIQQAHLYQDQDEPGETPR